MKQFVFFLICIPFLSLNIEAQNQTTFGLKGGLNLTFFQVVESNFGPSTETEVGYYGGFFVNVEIDEGFSIQPEFLYIGLSDFKFLNAPIYVSYEVVNNLNILVGPSMNYFFDFFVNKFKVRGDISVAFQLSDILDAHVKYTLGFEELSPNGLFFGVGIRL
ncbi:hypothetical protein SAMN04515667_1811 [Formosa sp. Hel1_31_208]|uniref:hypothetical protein n=1 Tax=Formosa sp. Hel1_31_208 TaxID=1798225 RepID=UPI00087A9908|nr:hypothetical protein [Formosa sp. Hel1_31_208]SDS27682.1 hypothetical protein SAMN04515667_1811 [Formosa sp. Hel1_31_208]